ncbi:MAG: helix-turn-helix domain-containing protein [Firmicutes bacterium]|nr:helix-turn-helix domain-containing protein [Bacillota bacterium]NBI62098.1 DNA-binding protein [Clostridiales bacterium]
MFEYMTAQEAAELWGISVRRAQRLCKKNWIEGILNINRVWLIPKGAVKLADTRKKIARIFMKSSKTSAILFP